MNLRLPLAAGAAATALAVALAPGARAAAPVGTYSTQLLHFAVHVGPGGSQACDVVGELFTPSSAGPDHRVPAILTTNGFGGSYTDQIGVAKALARAGYVVLTYSGLGFGGSGCRIYLDDPDYDGAAASQLVSFLGGAPGIAYTDSAHSTPFPALQTVVLDRRAHDGTARAYDPRVGMIGGSYGGEIQFAAAGVDPRIDTIVPMITWNDLSYSLAPNNAGISPGSGSVSSAVPGAAKSTWASLFSADGVADGIQGAQADPSCDAGCPNFAQWVCPALAFAATTGYPDAATIGHLRHASVADYMSRIRVPVLLMQGENDTLFNLNEATATYEALRAQGTPVRMVWQSWGHSGSTPAPGELDLNAPDPATQYESGRVFDWFGHWLQGNGAPLGPDFAWFRDWVTYSGDATPAYGTATSYPAAATHALYLSSGQTLTPGAPHASSQTFSTPPAGAPTGTGSLDAVGGAVPGTSQPDRDEPGTFASWATSPLTAPVDVVGPPVLHVQLSAPVPAATAGPAGDLVVFAKLYDVAPDGTASLIHGLVAPARIADTSRPASITLPGIVHRFAAGHRIELVISGGDLNYRGGLVPTPVTVTTGSPGQVLDLPVTPSA